MRFRWWMAPAIGIGAVALANTALISTTLLVRPQQSSRQPYAASAQEDQRIAERTSFRDRGWRIDAELDAAGATLHLRAPPAAGRGVVRLYRPDDAAADREIAWPDPAQPLRIDLPRPGAWTLSVAITDAQGLVLADELRIRRP